MTTTPTASDVVEAYGRADDHGIFAIMEGHNTTFTIERVWEGDSVFSWGVCHYATGEGRDALLKTFAWDDFRAAVQYMTDVVIAEVTHGAGEPIIGV